MVSEHESHGFFDLPHPIIQAPMVSVSTPALAAAVSNAGGLGSLGLGASSAREARAMIEETRALTGQRFAVNLFCHAPARRDAPREAAWIRHFAPRFRELGVEPPRELRAPYPSFREDEAMFRMLLELRPAFVSFHFGLPDPTWISTLAQAGVRTMATATSVAEGRLIEAAGVDAIVAQGIEAGGHRGVFDAAQRDEGLTTAVLVRLLAQQSNLPVIAAGGIMDGAGIRSALSLGACAVQLGTAFLLCPEAKTSPHHRAMLASGRETQLTSVVSGRPARGLRNRLMELGEVRDAPALPDYPIAYDLAKRLHAARSAQGDHEYAAEWAGQGAPLVRALPAAELVATLLSELAATG